MKAKERISELVELENKISQLQKELDFKGLELKNSIAEGLIDVREVGLCDGGCIAVSPVPPCSGCCIKKSPSIDFGHDDIINPGNMIKKPLSK